MNEKKIILIGVVLLLVLSVFIGTSYKNRMNEKKVSTNILYITQPINSFSGTVEKIEGNTITVSQNQSLSPTGTVINSTTPDPTPKIFSITYKATISGKTKISQPPLTINYLFKDIFSVPQAKLTSKDIKVGQYIIINSKEDLRTLTGDSFEAVSIYLPQKINMINGKVISVAGNTLTIKAVLPLAMVNISQNKPKEYIYTINLTSQTEISHYLNNNNLTAGETTPIAKPEKLSISDLKKDMQINVYTDTDVTQGSTFTALRIEPIISIPPVANVLLTPTRNTSTPGASMTQ